jgi:ElaB/YqjD/DUF883 family membrane-anchored ribosome-binding protein
MTSFNHPNDGKKLPNDLADKALDAGLRAADKVGQVVGTLEGTANQLIDRGSEAKVSMQKVAGNFGTAIDRSVSDQPLTTLGFAAAAGFILGALWKA